MKPLHIMDTTIRDGQQSLWATRMSIGDMLPILPKMDKVGYWAIEAWGGATFDACLRFLDENPWERLRAIKKCCPQTPLSMLVRGQNLVGYRHYSKEIVTRFIHASHKNGIEVFRVFDALNDIRNVVDCAEAIKSCGAHFEGAISYTVSPVHTLDSYIDYAIELKNLGADTIALKDMAGLLTPYRTERLVHALKDATGLPIHLHCHYVGGMAPANFIKGAEAGAAIIDTASAPLAFGNSHPAVEMMTAALRESGFDTGFDLDLLFEIADYWEGLRMRNHLKRGVSSLIHMQVYSHQIPGGMMSNLVSQLEVQKAADRLDDVVKEIPRVRAEVGFPPLVTPMSQIVGTQAVFNVLTGKRWSVVSAEMKDYLCGLYGKAPGPIDLDVLRKVTGDTPRLDPDVAPGSLVTTTYEEVEQEIGDLARSEEDVLMYALFPLSAKAYLTKHRTSERVEFMMPEESSATKEDDYVDMNQIRDLIRAVEESGIGEITIKEAGSEITVRKPEVACASLGAQAVQVPVQTLQQSTQAQAQELEASSQPSSSRPASWVAVTSPMVGTYYSAPAPDQPHFVQVGDEVMAGDPLCIVEAMKLMNEICAEEMCVVKEVCMNNAEPVEFGTVLFYVEPVSGR